MFVTNRSNMSALELTIHPGDLGILGIWGSLSCWVTARITLKMPKLTNMKLATSRRGEKKTPCDLQMSWNIGIIISIYIYTYVYIIITTIHYHYCCYYLLFFLLSLLLLFLLSFFIYIYIRMRKMWNDMWKSWLPSGKFLQFTLENNRFCAWVKHRQMGRVQ